MMSYKLLKNSTNELINDARRKFYKNFIDENNFNQHNLFTAAKKLLNHGDKKVVFPPTVDKLKFVNDMGSFFYHKIHNIHTKLDNITDEVPDITFHNACEIATQLSSFNTLTQENVLTLIKESGKKSSAVDPIPTSLVIDLIDVDR